MSGEERPAGGGPAMARHGISAVAAVLLGLLLSACDHYRFWEEHTRLDNPTAVGLSEPELRHPIHFAARPEALDIEVPPGAEGLSPNQHSDVERFLYRHIREAKGRLIIAVPQPVRDRVSIARSMQDIQRHVAEAGIDYRVTRLAAEKGSETPVIRLSYRRPVAIPPPCGDWSEDVGRNEERIPYPNWGCATQHNTAVMVDNARDLQGPQPEYPRSSERRSAQWSEYVGGAGSGASSSAPASGSSATASPPAAGKQ